MSGTYRYDPSNPDFTPKAARPRSVRRRNRQWSQAVKDKQFTTIIRDEAQEKGFQTALDNGRSRRVNF